MNRRGFLGALIGAVAVSRLSHQRADIEPRKGPVMLNGQERILSKAEARALFHMDGKFSAHSWCEGLAPTGNVIVMSGRWDVESG